jgi:glucosamine--fructose-6-phosphate aminotransferase (isomerizing)
MCGIFGAVIGGGSALGDRAELERSLERLFLLSESRGKEAAGLALQNDAALAVYKTGVPASEMIRHAAYREMVKTTAVQGSGLAFIGHSRLVTDGARELNRNNQPVVAGGVVGIHNGIIVNHAALWQRHRHLERQLDVDSEVIFALVRDQLDRGATLPQAAQRTFAELQGAASVAALFDDRDELLLATNNGSLYYRSAPRAGLFVFASEGWIMDQFAARHAGLLGASQTVPVRAGEGVVVRMADQSVHPFHLTPVDEDVGSNGSARSPRRTLLDLGPVEDRPRAPAPVRLDLMRIERRFPYLSMRDRLRRCIRCVLPETMPFVDYDEKGLCAYCRNHRPLVVRGREELEALVRPYRRTDGRPDCIVGVSGGRDSIYGLHYIKTVLGMNPVAYTYDWGMVTDLARRNVSRICGKLGIEHILVSADIPKKRAFIRANVEAWLARPSLGTIPLFMAGDKAYFYYLQKARERLGVELSFLCENLLERTDFKTGFAGIPPAHDDDHVYTLPLRSKLGLARFYATEFARNRRYLNASLADTARAFAFYYLIKRDYTNLYRYVEWDEATIESTLLGEYDFELAEDTQSTWRIGDGTAPFYNYIYHAIAGFSENDTFRSNQIRNGAQTRERSLELIERDNRPRFPSIHWYLETIGLDRSLEQVLEIIDRAPKLYDPNAPP